MFINCDFLHLFDTILLYRMHFWSSHEWWRPKNRWLLVWCTILLWRLLMLVRERYIKQKFGWSRGWTLSSCRNSSIPVMAIHIFLPTSVWSKVMNYLIDSKWGCTFHDIWIRFVSMLQSFRSLFDFLFFSNIFLVEKKVNWYSLMLVTPSVPIFLSIFLFRWSCNPWQFWLVKDEKLNHISFVTLHPRIQIQTISGARKIHWSLKVIIALKRGNFGNSYVLDSYDCVPSNVDFSKRDKSFGTDGICFCCIPTTGFSTSASPYIIVDWKPLPILHHPMHRD